VDVVAESILKSRPKLAQSLGEQFDRMRMYVTALPALSVIWVELLISRFEITQALWSSRTGGPTNRLVHLHEYHVAILREVRLKCQGYVQAAAPPTAPSRPEPAPAAPAQGNPGSPG